MEKRLENKIVAKYQLEGTPLERAQARVKEDVKSLHERLEKADQKAARGEADRKVVEDLMDLFREKGSSEFEAYNQALDELQNINELSRKDSYSVMFWGHMDSTN